jgi:hypothetical protein
MARNDQRPFFEAPDRAHLRAGARSPAGSWHAFANATVASALVAALVVSGLALCEALVPTSAVTLARLSPAPTQSNVRRACVLPDDDDTAAPLQVDPALVAAD